MRWLLTTVPVPAFVLIGLNGFALSCAAVAAWYRGRAATLERSRENRPPMPPPVRLDTPRPHDCTIDDL